MTTNISTVRRSTKFMEIENLVNLAKHHKKHCNQSNCGVSIYRLKQTIYRLMKNIPSTEWEKLEQLINQVEWI